MDSTRTHDVGIIGGGAAGLSAAVALARSRRSVVLVDAAEPRNAPAGGVHNVLGRDGVPALEMLTVGRLEAKHYGVDLRDSRAVAVRRDDGGFLVVLESGDRIAIRRLLLATGLIDELPDVPGVRECWGKTVLHCAYCHGWEVRGQRIGVLGTRPMSVHQALLFRQLSDDVTLFVHHLPEPGAEAWDQLEAMDIRVVRGVVERLRSEDGLVRDVLLGDGRQFAVDAVIVAPRFVARVDLYEQLGGASTDDPNGSFIATDPTGRTAIAGVWAAGNVSDLRAMVAPSMGAGVSAAVAINADLVSEDARSAVRSRAPSA